MKVRNKTQKKKREEKNATVCLEIVTDLCKKIIHKCNNKKIQECKSSKEVNRI